LLPESGFAGGQQRILAGVPAEKMRRFGVCSVVVASLPNFVKEIGTGLIGASMKIVLKAAFFFSRGSDECAEFRFEQQVLPFASAQENNQGNGAFGEFLGFCAMWFAAASGTLRFSFGHDGGDCTANEGQRKDISILGLRRTSKPKRAALSRP
jgi:hypothetical protein